MILVRPRLNFKIFIRKFFNKFQKEKNFFSEQFFNDIAKISKKLQTGPKFLSKFLHFRPIIQQLKPKNIKIINHFFNNSTHTHKRKNLYLHTYISNTTKKPKTPKNIKNTKIRNPADPASTQQ